MLNRKVRRELAHFGQMPRSLVKATTCNNSESYAEMTGNKKELTSSVFGAS